MNSFVTLEFIVECSSHTYLFQLIKSLQLPSVSKTKNFHTYQSRCCCKLVFGFLYIVKEIRYSAHYSISQGILLEPFVSIPTSFFKTIDFSYVTTIHWLLSLLKNSCVRDEHNKTVYNSFQCCFLQTMTQISIRSDRNLNQSAHYTHTVSISKFFECIREPKHKHLSLKLSRSSTN